MTDLQKALATLEHSGHTQSQTFCCTGLILTNFILDKSSLCLSLSMCMCLKTKLKGRICGNWSHFEYSGCEQV